MKEPTHPAGERVERQVALLSRACYWAGMLLILIPILHFGASMMPARPGDLVWRMGMTSRMSDVALIATLGMLCLAAAAALAGHRLTLRLIAGASALVAVAILVVTASFALDAQAALETAVQDARSNVIGAAGATLLSHGLTACALATIAWVAYAASRRRR